VAGLANPKEIQDAPKRSVASSLQELFEANRGKKLSGHYSNKNKAFDMATFQEVYSRCVLSSSNSRILLNYRLRRLR
jgi:hypothetical protein